MTRLPVLPLATALLLLPAAAPALVIHVTPDGLGDAPTIDAGIAMAAPGDTVEVACGTYYEAGISMKDGVQLLSETRTPDCVTIDAQGIDSVIRCVGTDTLATIAGFTLTGGRAPFGGGLYLASASHPRIRDCRIVGNTASEGGGIYLLHAEPVIERCEFLDNTAHANGGGMACASTSYPVLTDCTFTGNTAGDYGGALASFFYTFPTMIRCTLAGNSAGVAGGAVMTLFGDLTLDECVVSGNFAEMSGGGLFFDDANPVITGCTIAGNRVVSGYGGGIFLANNIDIAVTGSILWGNAAPQGAQLHVTQAPASITFECSVVDTSSAWFSGAGTTAWSGSNEAVDPMFCSPASAAGAPTTAGDYGLAPGSPALALGGMCGTVVGGIGVGEACAALASPLPEPSPSRMAVRSFPNPFRGTTTLAFELPSPSPARVRIYDATGRLVRDLPGGHDDRGSVTWDGRDASGRPVAAGVYFSRIEAGAHSAGSRLVLLR